MVKQLQTNTIMKLCVIVLSVCMCMFMFGYYANATPLNAGTATMKVGCDFAYSNIDVTTEYMVVISDINTGKNVYSNVFRSDDFVDIWDAEDIEITAGHKYRIECIAPAGYGAQIWITESENYVTNPMHTNMVILEPRFYYLLIVEYEKEKALVVKCLFF